MSSKDTVFEDFWPLTVGDGSGLAPKFNPRRKMNACPAGNCNNWNKAAGAAVLNMDVVDLQEVRDFLLPAVAHESDMVGMGVVSVVSRLIRELHGEAELVVVLLTDLFQPLEFLDARDTGQDQGVLEELLLLGGALRML